MSAIPPGWLGSIAQTQGAQPRAQEARAREVAGESDAARASTFRDKLAEVIETDDRDTEVFADGHGDGGQGRASPDDAAPATAEPDSETDPGTGDPPHQLDIEA